jgi:hypothetical protein
MVACTTSTVVGVNGEGGLLATASLAHNLHHDFVQIGAGGVQGVDAAH